MEKIPSQREGMKQMLRCLGDQTQPSRERGEKRGPSLFPAFGKKLPKSQRLSAKCSVIQRGMSHAEPVNRLVFQMLQFYLHLVIFYMCIPSLSLTFVLLPIPKTPAEKPTPSFPAQLAVAGGGGSR